MSETRAQPKPAFIQRGEPWWNFLFTYRFEGAEYSFSIPARSEREARERLRGIALARLEGQQDGNPIPAWRAWHLPILTWWRNRNV